MPRASNMARRRRLRSCWKACAGKIALLSYAAVQALLVEADLRMGPNGIPRSTYCFRHTYATFRLSEGVDVYILSQQMGTSVKMIENRYGHVNTIKHADRVLMGIGGGEAMHADMDAEGDVEEATAKARQAAKSKQSVRPAHFKR